MIFWRCHERSEKLNMYALHGATCYSSYNVYYLAYSQLYKQTLKAKAVTTSIRATNL